VVVVRGEAHAVIGGAAAAALAALTHTPVALLVLSGAWGGLLPDVDHPGSTLGRYVPWPAVERAGRGGIVLRGRRWFGGRVVWHRGETHSVGGAAMASIGAGGVAWAVGRWARAAPRLAAGLARAGLRLHPLAWGAWAAAGVAVGYMSHLAADTANRSPQMLWWPLRRRMVHPPWRGVPEASAEGRLVEWGAAAAALAVALLLGH
jgi:inner membrane protein